MQLRREAESEPQTRYFGAMAVLLGVAFLVFGPSLAAPFHLDDATLFSDPVITSSSGWWYVWRPLQTRPLTYFTFWLNYQFGGEDPIGYHAVNVSAHILATWLLFRLVSRIGDPKAALIAAALFALHPVQVEPVAYVFERATLLAAIFCLLCAHAWLDGNYLRAAGFFIFALLSKEECAAFPVFLLALRPVWRPALWMSCLSLLAGARVVLALELLHVAGAGSRAGISPAAYFATQGTVIWRYLRLLVVPYGFTCDPDIPIVRDWRAWIAWAAIAAVAALAWKLHPHGKWFVVGIALLAPSSTIFPAEDIAADRRLYLAMAAFGVFAGLSLRRVSRRAILVTAAAGLAALSAVRVHVWRSEERLWAEAVDRAPRKLRPRVLLSRVSDTDDALRMLEAARALAPNDPRPFVEKAARLLAAHRPESAIPELETALALAPDDLMALNNYGVALSAIGDREAAVRQFRHALRIDPCSPTTRRNLLAMGIPAAGECR